MNTQNNLAHPFWERKITITLHGLAIFSIAVYIVLAVLFEASTISNSSLASLGLYFCLGMCGFNLLVRWRFRVNWFVIVMLFFGLVLSFSFLYSPTTASVKNMYLYRFWTTAIILILIMNTVRDMNDVRHIFQAMILAGILLAFTVYQEYGIENLIESTERLEDELGNQNMLGLYCAFPVILSFFELMTNKKLSKLMRILYIAAIVICVPVVMFTGSRKAILVILAALLTLALLLLRFKGGLLRLFLIGAAFAAIIVIIMQVPAFSVINERFGEMFNLFQGASDTNIGDQNRALFFEVGLQKFADSPFIGNGFFYSHYVFGVYTHNNFVELLMNNGILGFVAFYALHVMIATTAFKRRKNDRLGSSLVIMLLVAILVCDIGVITYYDRYIMLLLTLISFVAIRQENDKEEHLGIGACGDGAISLNGGRL